MRADRRAQFERYTATDDGFGMVEAWTAHGSPVPAEKRDVSDAERMRASEIQAHITTRFRVRWSAFTAGLTPKDRLICEGRRYDISGIKEMDRRRTLEITAAARADLTVVDLDAEWLLDGGVWNDAGVWDDTANWSDAA